MIKTYRLERFWMNSACDWGVSVPPSAPYTALEMRRRGRAADRIDRIVFRNPAAFLGQCPKFRPTPL